MVVARDGRTNTSNPNDHAAPWRSTACAVLAPPQAGLFTTYARLRAPEPRSCLAAR